MGKGSSRRREDRARVAANWDAVFGPKPAANPQIEAYPDAIALVYPQLTQPEPGSFERHMAAPQICPDDPSCDICLEARQEQIDAGVSE